MPSWKRHSDEAFCCLKVWEKHEKLLDEVSQLLQLHMSSTQLLSGDANPHGTLFAGPVHLLSIRRMHETIGAHSQVRGGSTGQTELVFEHEPS